MVGDEVENLVIRVRNHYVAQFREFIERQQSNCAKGASEVKFELTGETNAYRRLAVVDFVRNDEGTEGVWFQPENILSFEPIEGQIGGTTLTIVGLRWDQVIILHDAKDVANALTDWFDSWFDPGEHHRFDSIADISGCIHAVFFDPADELEIDLGTAPADAFWELLNCLVLAGATKIHVSS